MHFLSQSSFQTLKTMPKGPENRGTGLLVQAGFIRQEMAGVYNFLPMGLRVMQKIEQIVREEMNGIGCEEILMSTLVPKEEMETTDRWGVDVLFKLSGANDAEYALGFSHEEVATPIMIEFLRSYKTLPSCIYQIQTKFRNEKRAKSGLLRGREFRMKDAYSFHLTQEDLDAFFEAMKQAYIRAYDRLGIGDITVPALADGGEFTPNPSIEFQTFTPIGEDQIFYDQKNDTWYNKEIAPAKASSYKYEEEERALQKHVLKGKVGVQALIEEFSIDIELSTKTLFYEQDNKMLAIVLRSDYDVNEWKVRQVAGVGWKPASPEIIKKITGAEPGYAGLYNLPEEVELYVDEAVEPMVNFETGGNETGLHVTNCNWGRDVKTPEQFYDLKNAKEGDTHPDSGEKYEVREASEVGNIFDLGKKYSEAFNLKTTEENGGQMHPFMGCYGLGISRTMGIIAEVLADDNGLVWPENIAPYSHFILVHGNHLEEAKKLAEKFESQGAQVLIDDRDIGFGQKAGDADLLGIPNRIILSDKTKEKGGYELKHRTQPEGIIEKI